MDMPDISSFAEAKPIITCTIEAILEPSDLAALASGALKQEATEAAAAHVPTALPEVDDPTDLKKLRERHHSVARLIASGQSNTMVAALTNYTPAYLSVLLNNPSMQELVEMYRVQLGAPGAVVAEKLRTVGLEAVAKLATKLEAGELDPNHLLGLAKLGLDRSGHGPSSTQHVVKEDHILDHAKLAELNAKARAASQEYIVPRQAVIASLPKPEAEESEHADSNS